MAASVEDKARNVIPRWRDYKSTLLLQELSAFGNAKPIDFDTLTDLYGDWRRNPTVWHASDLLSAAIILARTAEIPDILQFLAAHPDSPAYTRQVAERLLDRENIDKTERVAVISALEDVRKIISTSRSAAKQDPRNSVFWIDLARGYTILGLQEKACKAVTVALSLSPTNRFVLRSAARFYLHIRQALHAHRILRTAENTKYDPWLLAAEIAIASSVDASPRFALQGRKLLEQLGAQLNTTELASALATLELSNGKNRKAKKLFEDALVVPNENSLAQAEWASGEISNLHVNAAEVDVPLNFEARAREYFTAGHFDSALTQATEWFVDQPFSSRPAALASYIGATFFDDHKGAIEIVKKSLAANPGDPVLLNNLAFSLASLDRTAEAENALSDINRSDPDFSDITVTATKGLIEYRRGNVALGQEEYLHAIDLAQQAKNLDYLAQAMLYFAREELLSGSLDAEIVFKRAVEASELAPSRSTKQLAAFIGSKYFGASNERAASI